MLKVRSRAPDGLAVTLPSGLPQITGRADAATFAPIVRRLVIAEVAAVGAGADQFDECVPPSCSAKLQVAALSSHMRGVCRTKRLFMPRFSVTWSALIVSSRQSG
jgi:hypothetical protein